jgi:glutathione S-transferase kappa 1
MKGSDNRPPMYVPAKGSYMGKDLHRLRSFYQVPLNRPANVVEALAVKGSLAAQRLLTATTLTKPSLTESLSRELWIRIWSKDEDITTPESLTQALKAAGLKDSEAAELLKASTEKSVADKLKETTKEALDLGAFGAPIVVIRDSNNEKQMVFGSDRFELIAWMIGEKYEGPLRELAASKL